MLSDLGSAINKTLTSLFQSPVTDQSIETAINSVCTALLAANVSTKQVVGLRAKLRERLSATNIPGGINKAKVVNKAVFDELVNLLDPSTPVQRPVRGKPSTIVFVGLQGAGKTTSICKYAHYHQKKGFKVGIVCADTFRAGAFDQIKQNALKIKVPYFGGISPNPVIVAHEGVEKFRKEKFDLILVDTSGRHTQEKELFLEMQEVVEAVNPTNIVFVMDAGIGQSAEEQAKGFKDAVELGSIILTKIDGTNRAGGALTSVAATGCPIEFIGRGEGMEDFEVFDAHRFVGKMLGMGDIAGLAEKIQDLNIDEEKIIKKFQTGTFTLRDFYDQFQQLMSLGPLGKVMEMIPGFSNFKIPDESSFQKLVCIFDSLAESELDSSGELFETQPERMIRIAKGSGVSVEKVAELISQYRMMSGMMKKLSKAPGFGDLMKGDPSKMNLSQKTKLKQQARGMLPKEMFDQLSSFFN
ncbi:Signal recognition particle 54 kDa protein [Astathelohania contejeani]|uniref:signal-recognition-particle GTPase n=1 Tax=Astathelohania contejeani TaxID=164912 RepID=A0ABQ7HXI9_9MICR|nr:Signal recognition particle 54 kDa protein [Thelohania contejeani]